MGLRAILIMALAAVLSISGCNQREVQHEPNPLAGMKLFVNHSSKAAIEQAKLAQAGRQEEAAQLKKIAEQPTGIWLNGTADDERIVRDTMTEAGAGRTVPIFVIYNIPHRDIGTDISAGGATSAQAYRNWLMLMNAAMADGQAIVIVEPDGVAAVADGRLHEAKPERLELIKFAVQTLAAKPSRYVYIDAGNHGWTHPDQMSALLRQVGIEQARGVAVNVSNFYTDAESADYGTQLSKQLGGKGVIVDRSRNGIGAEQPHNEMSWCNPPGRALGQPPAIGGATDLVQAWLWVKPPGESDGACRPGAPGPGDFWLDYALGLVKGK